MPVVKRAEADFLRFVNLVDYLVVPVNTMGTAGAGLGLAVRTRFPPWFFTYNKRCRDGEMKIGGLHVYQDVSATTKILSLATREHWVDPSETKHIKTCLTNLRAFLQKKENRLHTVAMPMLGGVPKSERGPNGEKLFDYAGYEEMLYDYLDDLDNVVHLSMLPAYFPTPLRYLAIIGYAHFDDEKYIEWAVNTALETWGLTWTDFEGVVSGGGGFVDLAACGLNPGDDCLAKRHHPRRPIVCKADWERFGKRAGMERNPTVADIGTHFVAIIPDKVPKGKRPPSGTPHTVSLAEKWNKTEGVPYQKEIMVFSPTMDD